MTQSDDMMLCACGMDGGTQTQTHTCSHPRMQRRQESAEARHLIRIMWIGKDIRDRGLFSIVRGTGWCTRMSSYKAARIHTHAAPSPILISVLFFLFVQQDRSICFWYAMLCYVPFRFGDHQSSVSETTTSTTSSTPYNQILATYCILLFLFSFSQFSMPFRHAPWISAPYQHNRNIFNIKLKIKNWRFCIESRWRFVSVFGTILICADFIYLFANHPMHQLMHWNFFRVFLALGQFWHGMLWLFFHPTFWLLISLLLLLSSYWWMYVDAETSPLANCRRDVADNERGAR